ncbi:MAG: response regulator [Elusimicrobia bacterium]|nr:response regulator [Elusimicrobiota bacterium]
MPRPIDILLVEDDPGDVELTTETLKEAKMLVEIHTAENGEQALAYLRKEGAHRDASDPDLILLDLNMPIMDGREFLRVMKRDDSLRKIPVVVLTTSSADEEVMRSYDLGANCYVTKPVGLEQFSKVVHAIESFWLTVVKLPPRGHPAERR